MTSFEFDEPTGSTNESRSLYGLYAQHEQAGIIFHGTLQNLGELSLRGTAEGEEAAELLAQASRAASMPPLADEPFKARFHGLSQGYYVELEDGPVHRDFPHGFEARFTTLSGSLAGVKRLEEGAVVVGVKPFSVAEEPIRSYYRSRAVNWAFHHPLAVKRYETDLDRPIWVPVESLLLPKMDFSYLKQQWQAAERAGRVVRRMIPPAEA